MLLAETRMVRRDFQILEMFSRCKLQRCFCIHIELEPGCMKTYCQQIWDRVKRI